MTYQPNNNEPVKAVVIALGTLILFLLVLMVAKCNGQ